MLGIPQDHGRRILPGAAWAAVFVVLMGIAQFFSEWYGGWRFDRGAYEAGAWWQLVTAQWVHFGVAHAAVNAIGMALMLLAFQGLVGLGAQCAALIGGHVGVSVVLALDPACSYYAGASGALHGFLAGNALGLLMGGPPLAMHRRGAGRLLGATVLALLVLKLCVQSGASQWATALRINFSAIAVGSVPVYYPAHGAGVWGGLLAVALYGALHRAAQHAARRKQQHGR